MRYLSKTKYLEGLQCPKLLWCEYNRKDLFPPITPVLQFAFDEGHRVGALAQSLFPDGILLKRKFNPDEQSAQSLAAVQSRKPLFEAGFVYNSAYALADILVPVEKEVWDLVEVKSSTGLKDEYYHDAAFQKYVFEGAGLNIRTVSIMYINKDYIRHSDIEPQSFFLAEDITKQTAILAQQIEKAVSAMLKTIENKEVPNVSIGPYCFSPHECPLIGFCWKNMQDNDIFTLHQGGQRCFDLLEQGIAKITDIPDDYKLNAKQVIQIEAQRKNQPYCDKEALREFLNRLRYPLYFLDFETIAPAIPVYDNAGPYKSIPFQYSLYIIEKEGAEPKPHAYIAHGKADPRPEILSRLRELLGQSGSILAYNAPFEKRCLKEAAFVYSRHLDWLKSIDGRFLDLLEPFKNFYYYHPAQKGRASIKNVLPALAGNHYNDLAINHGGMASAEYYRVTFDDNVAESERQAVRVALEKYCNLDTKGMIDILEALKKAVKTG